MQATDIAQSIREALENDAPLIQYQPIINLKIPAMACYSLQLHIEGPDSKLLSEYDLHKSGIETQLRAEIDRWLVIRALGDLSKLRESNPLSRLYINISGASITDAEFIPWLARQLKLQQMIGAGMVLCFRISDLSKEIKSAYRTFRKLQKMHVETTITQFPEKPQAMELLKFLRAETISISPRLLKTDKNTIAAIVENARRFKAKILLTDIDTAQSINLHWATGADMLQGKYIHGLMPAMTYDFAARS